VVRFAELAGRGADPGELLEDLVVFEVVYEGEGGVVVDDFG
jgi:hypothetical protein